MLSLLTEKGCGGRTAEQAREAVETTPRLFDLARETTAQETMAAAEAKISTTAELPQPRRKSDRLKVRE